MTSPVGGGGGGGGGGAGGRQWRRSLGARRTARCVTGGGRTVCDGRCGSVGDSQRLGMAAGRGPVVALAAALLTLQVRLRCGAARRFWVSNTDTALDVKWK